MTTAPAGEGPPVLVREATPADLAATQDLIAAARLPLAGLEDAALVLVAAAADGTVVGTVALERHGTGDDTAFLLRSAAVAPSWRGRGIGAELTAAALAHLDAGAPVALLTETAAGYFPRFGFTAVPRDRLPTDLGASAELQGACPASARALLRPASVSATEASGGR